MGGEAPQNKMKTQNLSPPKEHPDEEHSNKDPGDPVETGYKGDCQEDYLVILGFDFEKLYPSLRDMMAARAVYKAMEETEIEFGSVNYKDACKYISFNWSEAKLPAVTSGGS